MSTLETKTADNFIFDESLDPREHLSNSTPFLKKNLIYVQDQQAGNGSYTSGEVIIDSSSAASSGNMNEWRNSYTAVPMRDTVEYFAGSAVTLSAIPSSRFLVGSKNFCDLESVKVEANGKTIITATQGLEHLCTFKALCTNTQDSLTKDGAVINFWPDAVGQVGASATSYNAANVPSTIGTTNYLGANHGLIERQQNLLPTTQTTFLPRDNVKNEGGCVDLGVAFPATAPTTLATATKLQDLHYVRIIRHKDILDFFDKHGLSRGVGYRFTFKFNQAVTTVSYPTSVTPFAAPPSTVTIVNSQTSGSKQPAMLCVGPGTPVTGLTYNATATTTLVLTHAIDTTPDARINGCRMYIPSYELDPSHQEKLLSQPVIKKDFMDFMTQSTQTFAAPNAPINVQVSTSATNPRALIVIPRWSQTLTGNGGQGFFSDISPFSTVPGSTDGLLSLTNLQVKMGAEYVLPDRLNYGWSTFIDHISNIFALNGNQTSQTSGLITKKMWDANHRYYAFDLSRYPQAMNNLPQMISFECTNNSGVAIELQCILLYGRNAESNLANGTLTVTA